MGRHSAAVLAARLGGRMARVAESVRELWLRDNGVCHICLDFAELNDVDRDHLIPKSLGGPDRTSNFAIAHKGCNNARGILSIETVALLRARVDARIADPGTCWTPRDRRRLLCEAMLDTRMAVSRITRTEPAAETS